MVILSQPEVLSPAGNIKDFVISSSEVVRFRLYKGETLLLDNQYHPDASGSVTIAIKDVVLNTLSVEIPTTDNYIQQNIAADFIADISGTIVNFRAVRCGLDNYTGDISSFLTINFLTWQPQIAETRYTQPQWLTYYNSSDSDVLIKVKFYLKDGGTSIITIASVAASECVSINTQFAYIWSLLDTDRYGYYDVYVEDGTGVRLSYIQRYVLVDATERDTVFVFENTLGGVDSVVFTGANVYTPQHTYTNAVYDERSCNLHIEQQGAYSQSSGYKTKREVLWLRDFFAMSSCYIVEEGIIRPIVVIESTVSNSNMEQLHSFEFKYKLSDDNKYQNLARVETLTAPIEITTPDNLFFLVPRLAEFGRASLEDSLLFPVQSPYLEKWYTISFGEIQSHIADVVKTEISDYIGNIDSGKSYNRLDSWDNYNASTGDVLSATLGYGLKTDIESLQVQLERGVLSSVTVKVGDIAYKSVDGVVYLPVYPTIPTLLSSYTNDAGFITSSALNGYATQQWVKQQAYINEIGTQEIYDALGYLPFSTEDFTPENIKAVLGISDWALASSKPTYTWNEITSKPTSLKNPYALTFGSKTYDGSAARTITAGDLGALTSIPSEYVTETELAAKKYITGITSAMITTALGYTPYNSTNPNGYITSSSLSDYATRSWVQQQAYINEIGFDDIFNALGYLPFADESFTKDNIQAVLGISDWALASSKPTYTWNEITSKPTSLKNPYALTFGSKTYDGSAAKTITAGDLGALTSIPSEYITETELAAKKYITGITSAMVTAALGYTPYNSTNPNSYITVSSLSGYATQAWVKQQAYINEIGTQEIYDALGYLPFSTEDFTPENIKAVLGISDWALSVSKPSYAWSEITDKPSFATVAATGKYSDLSGLPTIPTYNFTGASFTSGNSGQGNHNCNNITSNGHWYYGQNGPAASLGATSTDGALYTQAYSDIWVAQIAQDYRNGNLFTRGRNNGSWSAWKAVSYNGHTHTKSQITDFPSSLPASDVYSWAKASTKPSYNFSEIGNKPTTLAGYGITDAYTKTQIDKEGFAYEKDIDHLQDQIDALSSGGGGGGVSGDYLPLTGGTVTGNIAIKGTNKGYMWLRESDSAELGRLETNGVDLMYRSYLNLKNGQGFETVLTSSNFTYWAVDANGPEIYGDLYSYAGATFEGPVVAAYIEATEGAAFNNVVYIAGDLFVEGEFQYSDVRYKNVLENFHIPNDVIADAPIFKYRWSDKLDSHTHIGSSAQYWGNYDKNLISKDSRTGKLGLNYISLAVAMGQSNAEEIRCLKMKIVELENNINNLKYIE